MLHFVLLYYFPHNSSQLSEQLGVLPFFFFFGINESKDDCPENTLITVLLILLFFSVLLSTTGSCYSTIKRYSFDTVSISDFLNVLIVYSRMEREKRRIFLFADSHVFLQENIISVVGFSSVLRRKYTKFSK